MYHKIGLIGYFAVGKSKAGGQEAKTSSVARTLQKHYHRQQFRHLDTGNWKKHPFQFFSRVLHIIRTCKVILVFPAQKSVRILSPLLVACAKPCGRQLHYVVIGGWLPEMTKHQKWLAYFLKKFDGIYVETSSMKTALEKQGFSNVFIMPNFKDVPILKKKELVYTTQEPFPFCTFSRVMKEKGIEDAIHAITQLNTQAGRIVATLDIYGKVDNNYKTRFNQLEKNFPPYIRYLGMVAPNHSVDIIKNYFALLFPTHYATEGIPGTLIDAYAAGVPVISALWNNYNDVFIANKTGLGFPLNDQEAFLSCIKYAVEHSNFLNTLKPRCLQEAQKYMPQTAIRVLLVRMTEKQI